MVGTASVESSEIVSALLNKKNISHQVLNAKQHEKEAEVIANAGRPGVVTCLLYTSPSPRDGLLSRMPSSA